MHSAAILLAAAIFGPACAFIGLQSRWYYGALAFIALNLFWLMLAIEPWKP